MGEKTSTIIMRLLDMVTGPAKGVDASLAKVGRSARGMKGAMHAGTMEAGLFGIGMDKLMGMLAAYGTYEFGKGAYKAFAEEERQMTRVGIRAGATREEMKEAHDEAFKIAQTYAVPADQVEQALGKLAKGGRTIRQALDIAPSAAKAAQAYGLSVSDAAVASQAMVAQMGIAQSRVPSAWDALNSAAKNGKIQVDEFAAAMPTIGADAARMGWTGEAGLRKLLTTAQAIAPQFATGAEAISALDSTLTAMHKKRVISAFKKQGVDLEAELEAAKKQGKDLFETLYNLSRKVVKGDMSKIGQLFQSDEIQRVMYALQQAIDKPGLHAKIRFDTGETEKNAQRAIEDTQAGLDRLANSAHHAKKNIGELIASTGVPEVLTSWANAAGAAAEGIKHVAEEAKKGLDPEYEALRSRAEKEGWDQHEWARQHKMMQEQKAARIELQRAQAAYDYAGTQEYRGGEEARQRHLAELQKRIEAARAAIADAELRRQATTTPAGPQTGEAMTFDIQKAIAKQKFPAGIPMPRDRPSAAIQKQLEAEAKKRKGAPAPAPPSKPIVIPPVQGLDAVRSDIEGELHGAAASASVGGAEIMDNLAGGIVANRGTVLGEVKRLLDDIKAVIANTPIDVQVNAHVNAPNLNGAFKGDAKKND